MKKVLAFILCLVIMVGILPSFNTFAATDLNGAETAFIKAVINGDSSLSLKKYNITLAQLEIIEDRMFYLYPETNHYYYNCNYTSSGKYISKVTFNYKNGYKQASIKESVAYIYTTVNAVVNAMPKEFSDVEKALFAHDWIATYFIYDMDYYKDTSLANYTVYELFKEGKGVCQSYAFAYMLIMKKCGIDCSWVMSKEDNHSWNVVEINGKWHHVDVTHDDYIIAENGNITVDYFGQAAHGKFLLSDTEINDGHHDNWFNPIADKVTCSAYTGGNIWKQADSSMVYDNNYWYYLDYEKGGLVRTSDSFASSSLLATLDKKWYYNGSTNNWYNGYYSGMASFNGRIFYNDCMYFYSYDISTGRVDQIAYLTDTTAGSFFGFVMYGTKFLFLSTKDIYKYNYNGSYDVFEYTLCSSEHNESFIGWQAYGVGNIYNCDLCGTVFDFSDSLKGDVNGDGVVNASDLATLKLALAGCGNTVFIFADMDRNDSVNGTDLATLKIKLAGA